MFEDSSVISDFDIIAFLDWIDEQGSNGYLDNTSDKVLNEIKAEAREVSIKMKNRKMINTEICFADKYKK